MKNIKLLWNRIWNLFDYIYYRSVAFYEKYESLPEIMSRPEKALQIKKYRYERKRRTGLH